MPDQKELERIGGLFGLASNQSRPFLNKCSEAKYLAVQDLSLAKDETLKLARQALKSAGQGISSNEYLSKYIASARKAIESGQLDSKLEEALTKLRRGYLERVLRPAVRTYLSNDELNTSSLEMLYESALRIDGLLEVVHFLKRIRPAQS